MKMTKLRLSFVIRGWTEKTVVETTLWNDSMFKMKEKIFYSESTKQNRIFQSLVCLVDPWHEIPRETAWIQGTRICLNGREDDF